MKIKEIPCRFNILKNKDDADLSPRSTPADIVKHLKAANCLLYQAGLSLVLDTNVTRADGATATAVPGIFEIEVDDDVTNGVAWGDDAKAAAALNHREKVVNFNYIYQDDDGEDTLGLGVSRPASGAGVSKNDPGNPSSSWKSQSGVQYVAPGAGDATADPVAMAVRGLLRGPVNTWSMFVMDNCGDPTTEAGHLKYGNTIAHEFCHLLNLGHRADPAGAVDDCVNYPPDQNMMHNDNGPLIAQDIDIVQTLAILENPLFP